jgi:hypothetical protein
MALKTSVAEPAKKSNKFRLVVFEGDMSDGSVSEIAHALSAALRPTTSPVVRQLLNGKAAAQLTAPENEGEEQLEEEEGVIDDEPTEEAQELETADPKAPKASRPRKPKPPEYLPDLITDINAFKEFAKEKNPTSKNQQYLVAAYWLKKYGNTVTVTADMVYTCYKTAPWPAGFNDWSQTFHNLVHAELMRKVGKGEFAINPTGEHQVESGNA